MDIDILLPEQLKWWCTRLGFPQNAEAALQNMAASVRGDPQLRSIFGDFYTKTVQQGAWHREWSPLPVEPFVQERFTGRSSLFYLLAYLAALPHTWQRYQSLGIGEDVFDDTMLDFRFYMEDYFDLHGVWGYDHFQWIWRHLDCALFRLGRLQYMLIPFPGGVTAFRHRANGRICLLADPAQALRADGCAYGAGKPEGDEMPAGEDAWYPPFEARTDGWYGHPVAPDGHVLPHAANLLQAEWDLVLQRGDTVLDLHIPRKEPLNAQTCGASYARAQEFFRRVFPQRPFKALYCHTWMFTPQLQQFLPPESSLVRFQREFALYPHSGGPGFLWTFVFGERYPDRAAAPRDTSLRRAVLDWLDAGGEIFDLPGLMFHAPAAWGTQPYWSTEN
ncbi:MAG: acyltransferase domain-containing protein [Chloroflexota bacterium]